MDRTRTRAPRGFTLIELLLVLAVAAVLAAIAAPRYGRSIARYRVSSAAHRLAADLALAASTARNTSAARTVSFDIAKHQYQISGLRDLARSSEPYTVSLSADPYGTAIVKLDLGGDDSLVFDGYGAPDSGGSIVLEIGELTRTVTIDPVTGATRVD